MPFYVAEIHINGAVTPCCSSYCKNYSFGNIHVESLDSIWRSEKAGTFREKILNADYSLCDLQRCTKFPYIKTSRDDIVLQYFNDGQVTLPEAITISYDKTCNTSCIMCLHAKSEIPYRNNAEDIERLALFKEKIWPGLSNCKMLRTSGAGDPFGSQHMRKLIKEAAVAFPHIRFNFTTNGLSFTKGMYRALGLENRVACVSISVHAASEATYAKIVRHRNLKKVQANIRWIAEKVRQKEIGCLILIFVVQRLNYAEMPEFAEFAKKVGATASYTACRPSNPFFVESIPDFDVFDPANPEYRRFLEIMRHDSLQSPHCQFDGILLNARNAALQSL